MPHILQDPAHKIGGSNVFIRGMWTPRATLAFDLSGILKPIGFLDATFPVIANRIFKRRKRNLVKRSDQSNLVHTFQRYGAELGWLPRLAKTRIAKKEQRIGVTVTDRAVEGNNSGLAIGFHVVKQLD